MRILVTGATGFLAGNLIPALQERGHAVRGLAMPSEDTARLERQGVAIYRGDVCDPGTLAEPMRGVDGVFHLAAAIGTKRPLKDYQAVNVTGTENVCRAALAAGVGRLVHVSSTSVYRQGLGTPITEDYPLAPLPDPYPLTKALSDLLVQQMIRDQGLPACILRMSTFYGPGDRLNFGRIADRLMARRAIVVGSGRNSVPFVYVADVVQALLLALDHDVAEGQIFNITDDRFPTQEQLLCEIARQVGAPPPRVHVPYSLLYSAGFLAEGIAAVTRSPHPLVTRFGVVMYGAHNRYSIEKARQMLGYQPRTGLPDGLRLAAAWYLGRADSPSRPATAAAL